MKPENPLHYDDARDGSLCTANKYHLSVFEDPMQPDTKSKKEYFRDIAEVGSIDFQRRWCVHGTSAEYILLSELIETTIQAAKLKATQPRIVQGFF